MEIGAPRGPASRARRWAFWTAVLFTITPAALAAVHLAKGLVPAVGWPELFAGWLFNVLVYPSLVFALVYTVSRVVQAVRRP